MNGGLFIASALMLAIERATYAYIWCYPTTFRAWSAHSGFARLGGPVALVRALFVVFKVIQLAVFAVWIYVHADGVPRTTAVTPALALGSFLIAVGQVFNASVFARLGASGVFYGNRFGFPLPWVKGFPFSVMPHPQYVGTVMSIWGLFLVMRFPHPDWYALPLLETGYYIAGGLVESERG
jgi:phosphatidyl-N-methylethanolamine N-methyltransferase